MVYNIHVRSFGKIFYTTKEDGIILSYEKRV